MVRGYELFKEHFKDYSDKFIIIGGVASQILLEEAGLKARATQDIDMVLILESLDKEFAQCFWDFVNKGKYNNKQKNTGKKLFYRFDKPEDETYPKMLELFAKTPDLLEIEGETDITPIPTDKEIESLSAIILDEGYYNFILEGREEYQGVPVLNESHIIPLKARAYLDMTERQGNGEKGLSKDISKHKNDVFRLWQLLTGEEKIELPEQIEKDMQSFISKMENDSPVLKDLGINKIKVEEVLSSFKNIYGLE